MTATTPVERVAQFLEAAHFRRVPTPLEIAGLQIDVPSVFIGSEPSPDLVLVGDTVAQTRRQLQQTVEVVGRALDIKASRRPLTLILVGPRPEAAALRTMARLARVLPVGEAPDEATLQNWLAVLLPLKLPEPDEARGQTASLELLERTGDPIARELAQLARNGEGALVAERLHELVDEPPVCGRDFSEVSSQPLAAHVSEEVARLVAGAGRLQALVRDRTATAAAVAEAQRREAELTARRLSQPRRDELKLEIARLAEWSNALDALAAAARAGTALQRRAAQAAQRLAELNSQNSAVIGLRAQIGQYAADLGMSSPEPDAPLEATVASLLAKVGRQERLETETKTSRLRALETLEQIARIRTQLDAALHTLREATVALEQLRVRKMEAERRIEVARELAGRARETRTEKVRQVFNKELNSVWQDLFIRLAPDEPFVPAFALPETTTGPVEAVLETHYRSGGKGGNPRAMLSAGNLNTAALTLFLALHLSVHPVLPWLVIDDPVQSMDDVHIAQFAALLRSLKQTQRQVIIAVHDRQLFEYLALELSPAFNGDRLITIELGRGADGKTVAPWDLKTYEPDRAIAA